MPGRDGATCGLLSPASQHSLRTERRPQLFDPLIVQDSPAAVADQEIPAGRDPGKLEPQHSPSPNSETAIGSIASWRSATACAGRSNASDQGEIR